MIGLEGEIDLIDYDEQLDVSRDGGVVYVDGKPVKLDKTFFQITCNVQPLSGRELLMVPEGDRAKESYAVYTRGMPLKINDRIKRFDKYFQVQALENWGSYQKGRIMLDDVGAYSND